MPLGETLFGESEMRYLKQLNKLFWLVNIGLAIILIVVVSVLVTPKRPTYEDAGLLSQEFAKRPSSAVDDGGMRYGDPSLILERDVFGVARKEVPKGPSTVTRKAVKAKPKARQPLPFKLIGTVASEEGDSYAILEDTEAKTQDIYRVGAAIGTARIDRIEQNRVVVLNMGVREVLDLVLAGRQSTPTRTVARTKDPVRQVSKDNVVRVAANGEREINTRASASRLNGAAYSLMSKMELSPYVVAGEAKGLRISGLKDSMMAQLAGLKDGDILQSVNGQSVTNRRKAVQVLKKARNLGSARLQLSRGQEKKSLAFRTGSW